MNKTAEEIKRKILPALKEARVKKAGLFGSCVRGESGKDSDVDILVELAEGKSLFDLVSLEMLLQKKLDKKVDLLTYGSISPYLKNRILQEQVKIL